MQVVQGKDERVARCHRCRFVAVDPIAQTAVRVVLEDARLVARHSDTSSLLTARARAMRPSSEYTGCGAAFEPSDGAATGRRVTVASESMPLPAAPSKMRTESFISDHLRARSIAARSRAGNRPQALDRRPIGAGQRSLPRPRYPEMRTAFGLEEPPAPADWTVWTRDGRDSSWRSRSSVRP